MFDDESTNDVYVPPSPALFLDYSSSSLDYGDTSSEEGDESVTTASSSPYGAASCSYVTFESTAYSIVNDPQPMMSNTTPTTTASTTTIIPTPVDSVSLRDMLLKTEITETSILKSSTGMLSHYDHDPSIAVDDWQQCLATCNAEQILPLVYVANDVIQESKKRGNKYLEAFSPVLGRSLRLACNRDRSIAEKIRRTGTYYCLLL